MKGFTLIEIVIVISILGLLATFGFLSLSSSQDSLNVNRSIEDVRSLLLDARTRTLSGEGGDRYGVHFELDTVRLFKGSIYDPLLPPEKEIILPPRVTISVIALSGGGSEVLFKKLTGETDQGGTVTIQSTGSTPRTRVLEINTTGSVRVE